MYNGHVAKLIYKYGKFAWPGIVFLCGIVFLLVGNGKDASVAESMFGSLPSLVETLFAVIAPFPFFAGLGMAGALIGVAAKGKKERLPWYSYLIAAVVSIASGILFGYLVLASYIDSSIVSYALGAVVVLLISIPFMLLEKDADGELSVRIASSVLASAVFSLALLFTLRLAASRPIYTGEASTEPLAFTAFPAAIPLFAATSFAGASFIALLPAKRDKGLFIAAGAAAILSLLSAVATLSSGASYLSDIGFSFLVGTILGVLFPFLLVTPYFYRKEKAKLVYRSPVTPAIRRRQVEEAYAQYYANRLRLRKKNNSFDAVVPSDQPSLINRRRNYRHHK